MKKLSFFLFLVPLSIVAQNYAEQAKNITIIRDNWGIPHIYGKTDADAVFGLIYAQCEDDFKRIEMNYIEKLGRMAEIKGISSLYDDLQIKLLIDTTEAKADYNKAEPWLKKLLNAHADGINYFQIAPLSIIQCHLLFFKGTEFVIVFIKTFFPFRDNRFGIHICNIGA